MAAKAGKAGKEADEALDDAEDAEGESSAKRKLPLKLIAIAAVAILVVVGGGGTAYVLLGGKEEKIAAALAKPVFLDLPDVLVNLSTAGERVQYLKIKIVLELPDQTMTAQIQPMMPRVMDAFQTYLRELRTTDLEGSAGLYRLRDELARRVNLMIAPNRINAVLFKEIVIQ